MTGRADLRRKKFELPIWPATPRRLRAGRKAVRPPRNRSARLPQNRRLTPTTTLPLLRPTSASAVAHLPRSGDRGLGRLYGATVASVSGSSPECVLPTRFGSVLSRPLPVLFRRGCRRMNPLPGLLCSRSSVGRCFPPRRHSRSGFSWRPGMTVLLHLAGPLLSPGAVQRSGSLDLCRPWPCVYAPPPGHGVQTTFAPEVDPVVLYLAAKAREGRLVVCAGAGLSRAADADLPQRPTAG